MQLQHPPAPLAFPVVSRANPRFRRNNPVPPDLMPQYPIIRFLFAGHCYWGETLTTFDYADFSVTHARIVYPTDATALYTAITPAITGLKQRLLDTQAADWTLDRVTAIFPSEVTFADFVVDTPAAPGTIVGVTADGELAQVVQKQSVFKGQFGRGRTSVPVPQGSIQTTTGDTDTLTLAAGGLLALLATAMQAQVTVGARQWFPSIIGNTANPAGSLPPRKLPPGHWHANSITQCLRDLVLGTVRRRKRGRGR